MKVNNFNKIFDLIKYDNSKFYIIRVVQRAKDNPSMLYDKDIKYYYIQSYEQLEDIKEELILLGKVFNARVMITINNVDYLDIVDKLIKSYSTNTKPIFHNIGSITKYLKDIGDLWLFDIDENQLHSLEFLEILLEDFIVSKVPTVTGVHLIVTPFDDESYPCLKTMKDIMLFKNQSVCTLLYYE